MAHGSNSDAARQEQVELRAEKLRTRRVTKPELFRSWLLTSIQSRFTSKLDSRFLQNPSPVYELCSCFAAHLISTRARLAGLEFKL